MRSVAVIGGGPAGLRAAEVLSGSGIRVTLYEGKPSVGRKFLVAGRGGLNLTHSEDQTRFAERYRGSFPKGFWSSLLADFGNAELREWAAGLGVETFVGTSGRIFPKEYQSAQLLRRWVRRLREQRVDFRTRFQWVEFEKTEGCFHLSFMTQEGPFNTSHNAVVLALGGASWPETGSDASWVPILERQGLRTNPFSAANCGWNVDWDPLIPKTSEGLPLKNLRVSADRVSLHGELLITRTGLEGGALYQLGPVLRSMDRPSVILDLKPSFSSAQLAAKIPVCGTGDLVSAAAKAWRLSPAGENLLRCMAPSGSLASPLPLAEFAKAVTVRLSGPRPIREAISSAGGVSFTELDEYLMAGQHPGLFLAGEMLDWEAPTGGYLLQGCFATGTRAARGVQNYLSRSVLP
jgi:uncharacterized flavoprotein (TIGR03862 family)